ncbi:hypothetical protein OGAPHI_001109 [Ogataea philodendri]|uniref:Dolichyl-diphosphooligosaccharide--protein glycosyltransferase subunit WBP1 n=1 Tax=Ogataea philodendri TaxID=1378263 RepID=A0A9P8T9H3_9ASCO|nr:uncharacterized protein OGAPHI_001109 [Ogataea philodendri]KAH3670594.1 hypothetical protein OGAPHI_001109 [Ogataea philodendri]
MFFLLFLLTPLALAVSSALADSRTLVLYDSRLPEFTTQYSKLFQTLESKNFDLELGLVGPDSPSPDLFTNGFRRYQNILVLPTTSRDLVPTETLLQFVQDGGDVFVISDNKGIQTDVALFLNELGIFPSPKEYKYKDYHNGETLDDPEVQNTVVLPSAKSISYTDGSVALLSNSELLVPVVRAPRTSYTVNVDEGRLSTDSTWHSGSQGFLFVGFQGLNNARVFWTGSSASFHDASFNEEVVDALVNWTFQISGLIKATSTKHYNENGDAGYKIKDTTTYEIGLSHWNGDQWVPFKNRTDVQLEYVMLDPYYRLNLVPTREENSSQIYSTTFQIPDRHGMFTYKVLYQRDGYSFVDESTTVPVRHLANDEYPRSWEITNSWVYLSSALAVVIGWFAFVVLFVFSGNKHFDKEKTE